MNLPQNIDIETISSCNRVCPTCIRNSHPDREAVASWFKPNKLPMGVIEEIFRQARQWGFRGNVTLSHFNEPLMDDRIVEIAKLCKSYNFYTRFNSNGDFLTEQLAADLDGNLDEITVSLYMDEPIKSRRAEWVNTLFHKTQVIISLGEHIPTHFSPKWDVTRMASEYADNDCKEPELHLIINHRRQYLLCCEDVVGNFNLGYFPDLSLEEYWTGKRAKIQAALLNRGGRKIHPYCLSCPKP